MMQNKLVFINNEFSAKDSQLTEDVGLDNANIFVGKNTQVRLVEIFNDNNSVVLNRELHLDDSSTLAHEKIQHIDAESQYESVLNIFLNGNSSYEAVYLAAGSKKATENVFVHFKGEGANCEISALSKAKSKQHLSTKISVDHAVPNCKSLQNFRGIVSEKATAEIDSMAYVREGAQKSEAHQYLRNLLLDSTATVNANPQLEIYTDDVKCSHGATVGQLDEDALFYLQSRGINIGCAKQMLIDAFANEITDKFLELKYVD